jgi:hypothetical protein
MKHMNATNIQYRSSSSYAEPEAAKPEERDHMPVEVATSMLTTPKVKLTNRMRKQCMAARSKVFSSERPLVVADGEYARRTDYIEPEKRAEAKLAKKIGEKNLRQLRNIAVRCAARRVTVQRQYEKLQAKAAPEGMNEVNQQIFESRRQMGLALLSVTADRLDQTRDAAEAEIARRCSSALDARGNGEREREFRQ